jgi:hypothetical protein
MDPPVWPWRRLINVFTVEPAKQQQLLELLTRATETSVPRAWGLQRFIVGARLSLSYISSS